jgi:5-methylcytosine-specific restriction endonuclease McrA
LVFRAKHYKPYRYIPKSVRDDVLSAGMCVMCGSTDKLSVDHIYPVILGGSHKRENLQCMCLPCNSRKGARV